MATFGGVTLTRWRSDLARAYSRASAIRWCAPRPAPTRSRRGRCDQCGALLRDERFVGSHLEKISKLGGSGDILRTVSPRLDPDPGSDSMKPRQSK